MLNRLLNMVSPPEIVMAVCNFDHKWAVRLANILKAINKCFADKNPSLGGLNMFAGPNIVKTTLTTQSFMVKTASSSVPAGSDTGSDCPNENMSERGQNWSLSWRKMS